VRAWLYWTAVRDVRLRRPPPAQAPLQGVVLTRPTPHLVLKMLNASMNSRAVCRIGREATLLKSSTRVPSDARRPTRDSCGTLRFRALSCSAPTLCT
jgi:hypothetical protein